MASRRDMIQSFQFAARRVVSAVVLRQTDPREWPFRRLGGAGVATLMITVIALGAVAVYGMIVPGGKTSWKDGRSIIVDKRTGAPYVFVDGTLHPVTNYSSAALIAGTTTVTRTAASSLAAVPHGAEVGIAGAPETLPTAEDLVPAPWSLCSSQIADSTGTAISRTRLMVGGTPGGGTALGDSALLVTDTLDQRRYMIWHDTRYLLKQPGPGAPDALGVALKLDSQVDVRAGDAWLQALPAGRTIEPLTSGSLGRPSKAVPGAVVGQVLREPQSDQFYVAASRVLVPVTPLQAQIQQAAGGRMTTISPSVAATAPKSAPLPASEADPPSTVPAFYRPESSDTSLCATYTDESFTPKVLVNSRFPSTGGVATTGTGPGDAVFADQVWLPPGRAGLVQSLPSPQAASGPIFLVTDAGRRYAIPSADVLQSFGLAGAATSKLPSSLVVRIPEGPPLSPGVARQALGPPS